MSSAFHSHRRKRGSKLQPGQREEQSILFPVALIISVVLGFLMFNYQPGWNFNLQLVAPLLGIVSFALILADLRIGVVLLILMTGLSPEFSVGGLPNFRVEDFLMPLLFFGFIAEVNKRSEGFYSSPLTKPIFLFILAALLSSLLGIQMGTIRSSTPAMTSLFSWGKILQYFVMFFIVFNSIRSREDVKIYVIAMILTHLAVAFIGIQDLLLTGEAYQYARFSGPYGEGSNILGGYFIFNIALMIGLLTELENFRYRLVIGAILVMTLYPLLATFSRTSYVSLLGGLVFVGIFKRRAILSGLFLILIVFPLIFSQRVLDRLASILKIFGENPPSSWEARVWAWKYFGAEVFQYPLFGQGVRSISFGALDNIYIQVAVDTGLIGLAAFIWILYTIYETATTVYDSVQSDSFLSGVTLGFLAGFTGLVIHGLGASTFFSIRTMEPFMIASGIIFAIWLKKDEWLNPVQNVSKRDLQKLSRKGIQIPSSVKK